jgi:hypothetical protein
MMPVGETVGMDLWEQLSGLVTSPALPVCPVDLVEGEREVVRVPAERNPGSLSAVAGDLVLTTARLLFAPLMLHGPAEAREWACSDDGRGVTHVGAGRPPRLFRPPTVRVTDSGGETTEIGVLSSRKTPNLSAANASVRDAFLDALPEWLRSTP